MVGASVDITERRRAEEQRDLLVAELSHRVKNTLATVISIARLSFPPSPANNDARSIFEGRIRALAQTHGRLAEANWQRVSLETIVLADAWLAVPGGSEGFAADTPVDAYLLRD